MSGHDSMPTLQVEGVTSYAQVPTWILRAGDKLSHGSVRLYGVLMTYADNDTKTAFPSRDKLATDIGASVATVKRGIKELEDFGALIVTRRRNKRTGNFYSNHYLLVFQDPRVTDDPARSVMDDPITTPTVLTTPTCFTYELRPHDQKTQKSCTSKADASDAKGPGGLEKEERVMLVGAIQSVGKSIKEGHGFYDDEPQEGWDKFLGLMEEHMPDIYEAIGGDLENYRWTVGAEVAESYAAGTKLNKIINSAQQLHGPTSKEVDR